MMNAKAKLFWQLVAEAIANEYPNIYIYIMDRIEWDILDKISMFSDGEKIIVKMFTKDCTELFFDEDLIYPIDYSLEYQDPPGTFEGMPIDLVEP